MNDGSQQLRPGEYWVTQLDPESGLITQTVETNWLLAPFLGLAELISDIANGRMRTRDWVFVVLLVAILLRA